MAVAVITTRLFVGIRRLRGEPVIPHILGFPDGRGMMAARSWIQLFTTPLRLVKTPSAWSRYSAGMQSVRTPVITAVSAFLLLAMGIVRAQDPRSPVKDLHALVHAKQFADLEAKVDALDPQDPKWKAILELLVEGGEQQGTYDYLKRKAKHVLDTNTDVETRATAAFALATGYWRSGQPSEAKAAFGEVAKILPGSDLAQTATGNVHEINNLAIGQEAPTFVAATTTGERLSSDQLRGKVLLLHFWASW